MIYAHPRPIHHQIHHRVSLIIPVLATGLLQETGQAEQGQAEAFI